MLGRKNRWVVKDMDHNVYAGKRGGWVALKHAKRFRNHSDAQYIANLLGPVALVNCAVVEG